MNFTNTPLGRFRVVAITEGISYLVLLFIAMPLKYMAGIEKAVTYTGWAHGILFMLYIYTLISVVLDQKWNFRKTFLAFLASLIPFATFIMDKNWKAEEKALAIKKERVAE